MKGRKWLLVLLAVVVIAVIAAALCWDTIGMYLAPKAAVSAAVSDAYGALQSRFADSPVWILAKGLDNSGQNTVDLQLSTTEALLGQTDYDLTVQLDRDANRVSAVGTVTAKGKDLDLSLFLDRNFMAVSSEDLVKGGWYGITYDSFSADIRGFSLITFLVPNSTIAKWEASVADIQAAMNRENTVSVLPEFTDEDVVSLIVGILGLKSQVSRETTSVNGTELDCWHVRYHASGAEVESALGYIMEGDLTGGQITANFFLCEDTLVRLDLSAEAGEQRVALSLELGMDAAKDDITLWIAQNGSTNSITVSTNGSEAGREETILWNETEISYIWNKDTGALELTLPEKETMQMVLKAAENGFTLETADFGILLGLSTERAYDSTMTVTKGAEIATPDYKNLSQWSFEDMLVLLGGLGSLIGIEING